MQAKTLPQHVSVVIVGAGPTGLVAANLLGLYGINTLVFERNHGLSEYPKAISIDDEGLRVCQALGLGASIQEQMMFNAQAHYLSGHRYLARVAPTSQRNGYPLISTFYQPAFESTLLCGLERFPHLTLYFRHTVTYLEQDTEHVTLSIYTPDGSSQQLTCDYLLACDGGKSSIRHALDINMQPLKLWGNERIRRGGGSGRGGVGTLGSPVHRQIKRFWERAVMERRGRPKGPYPSSTSTPAPTEDEHIPPPRPTEDEHIPPPRKRYKSIRHTQRWLVVDCVNDADIEPIVRFFCSADRPTVSLPSPDNRRRWEFMYRSGEQDSDLLQPTRIQELMHQTRVVHGLPLAEQPAQIIRSACYTFYETLAATFSQGRIFLLGDAAHLMPPFGGQGMNSGLRDAHNLCWKIAMVLRGRASSRILVSYQEERKPHAAQMILFSSLLGRIIMPTSSLAASIRDLCFRILNLLPPLREAFAEAKVKPQPAYKHGLLIHTSDRVSRRLTGQMVPQPFVLTTTGQRLLLDDILGNDFTLLRFYNDPQQAFSAINGPIWERLGVRYLCIQAGRNFKGQSQPPPSTSGSVHTKDVFVAIDGEGVLRNFLQDRQDLFVLLRPDRYILGIFRLSEKDLFAAKLIKELDA